MRLNHSAFPFPFAVPCSARSGHALPGRARLRYSEFPMNLPCRSAALVGLVWFASACASAPPPPPPRPVAPTSERVFEAVAPSVVAILNDDRADREEEK